MDVYVLVGAGSAGSVLASRLSEDSDKKILLVEAGSDGEGSFFADIPFAAPELQGTRLDWSTIIEPQNNACFAFKNNVSSE